MTEQLEQAFQTANFMATLTNQRRVAFEEFQQSLIYYTKGSSFLITKELISFVKALIDSDFLKNVVLIDDNNVPVTIEDLVDFQQSILNQYTTAAALYQATYNELKSKRKVEDLITL
jgi:hypothetical protein